MLVQSTKVVSQLRKKSRNVNSEHIQILRALNTRAKDITLVIILVIIVVKPHMSANSAQLEM